VLTFYIPPGEHRARSGESLPKLLEDEARPHLEKHNSTHTPASRLPYPAGTKGSIHVLSDDVLMVIFDHCRGDNAFCTPKVWIPLELREFAFKKKKHNCVNYMWVRGVIGRRGVRTNSVRSLERRKLTLRGITSISLLTIMIKFLFHELELPGWTSFVAGFLADYQIKQEHHRSLE
jgi:hypothetical protein